MPFGDTLTVYEDMTSKSYARMAQDISVSDYVDTASTPEDKLTLRIAHQDQKSRGVERRRSSITHGRAINTLGVIDEYRVSISIDVPKAPKLPEGVVLNDLIAKLVIRAMATLTAGTGTWTEGDITHAALEARVNDLLLGLH